MADTFSDLYSSNSPERKKAEHCSSKTSDLFAVFPDCMIMLDDNDAQEDAKSSKSEQVMANRTSQASSYPDVQTSFPPHNFIAKRNTSDSSVQYHIHYHRLNSPRLLAAFIAGGAITLTLGFLWFKSSKPVTPYEQSTSDKASQLYRHDL